MELRVLCGSDEVYSKHFRFSSNRVVTLVVLKTKLVEKSTSEIFLENKFEWVISIKRTFPRKQPKNLPSIKMLNSTHHFHDVENDGEKL